MCAWIVGLASSSDFDSTLLLLLLRNMTGVPVPSTGWDKDPFPSDTSEGADLVRIRKIRNNYVHSNRMRMSRNDFGKDWTMLTEVTFESLEILE